MRSNTVESKCGNTAPGERTCSRAKAWRDVLGLFVPMSASRRGDTPATTNAACNSSWPR